MSVCSDHLPTTETLYDELDDDPMMIALITTGCVLTLVTFVVYIETVVYMKKAGYVECGPRRHFTHRLLLCGLFPVDCLLSVISLLVPRSTVLVDLLLAGYTAWCIYLFVRLTFDYFDNEAGMVATLANDKVTLSTPPCCCICCCCLRPITLTTKSMRILKLFAMQVIFVRPVLMFIAGVLWTDGQYEEELEYDSAYTYIQIISGLSTLLAIYGMTVLFWAALKHARQNCYVVKYVVLQIAIIMANIQSLLFNGLAELDLPGCKGTRGSRVRATALHHAVLIFEAFLLSLVARYGYRRREPHLDRDTCAMPPRPRKTSARSGNGAISTHHV